MAAAVPGLLGGPFSEFCDKFSGGGSESGVGDVVAEDALDGGECAAKFYGRRGLVCPEKRPE